VYETSDTNTAYNIFITIIKNAFEESVKLVKLSRKRSKDKKWITSALKTSSKVKNNLYKKWMKTRSKIDEKAYKQYRAVYRKLAAEAEDSYYTEMYDTKCNTIKKLWDNLNTVCSLKSKKVKNNVSELLMNNVATTDPKKICNAFNKCFAMVGEKLLEELGRTNVNINMTNFKEYCNNPTKHSMFLDPVGLDEIFKLINELKNSKSPGPDNIGPGLIKMISNL